MGLNAYFAYTVAPSGWARRPRGYDFWYLFLFLHNQCSKQLPYTAEFKDGSYDCILYCASWFQNAGLSPMTLVLTFC